MSPVSDTVLGVLVCLVTAGIPAVLVTVSHFADKSSTEEPTKGWGTRTWAIIVNALGIGGLIVGLFKRLAGVFVVMVRLDPEAAKLVVRYLIATSPHTSLGDSAYTAEHVFVRPENTSRPVFMRNASFVAHLFLYGRAPLLTFRPNKYIFNTEESGMGFNTMLCFFRGTVDLEELFRAASDAEQAKAEQALQAEKNGSRPLRFTIHFVYGSGSHHGSLHVVSARRPGSECAEPPQKTVADTVREPVFYRWDDLGPRRNEKRSALSALALQDELEDVVGDVHFWLAERKWYQDRGIPWRYGACLYGEPGTGKTSFIRALAEDIDFPVYVFDLASMHNDEFISSWKEAHKNSPCIVLFEDFDNVFHLRENVVPHGHLTFDCVLNQIGGIEVAEGVLLFVTTNKLELLDPAIGIPSDDPAAQEGESTRPGRLDRVVHVRPLDEAGRRKLANDILGEYPDLAELVLVGAENCSAAQFVDRCRRLAKQRHWENRG